jgi:hypothetical protein
VGKNKYAHSALKGVKHQPHKRKQKETPAMQAAPAAAGQTVLPAVTQQGSLVAALPGLSQPAHPPPVTVGSAPLAPASQARALVSGPASAPAQNLAVRQGNGQDLQGPVSLPLVAAGQAGGNGARATDGAAVVSGGAAQAQAQLPIGGQSGKAAPQAASEAADRQPNGRNAGRKPLIAVPLASRHQSAAQGN